MENDFDPKEKLSLLQKTPWWVLFLPSIIGFIVVTVIAMLFLT